MDYIMGITTYFDKLKKTIDLISKTDLNNLMNVLDQAKEHGKNIFIMGNGGSAATASHYCCDFNKGISINKDKKYKLICLNDNLPTMTAYANDISYDEIFVGQLNNLMNNGDYVIGISGSGNSKNVIKALEYANANDAVTIGITGYNGGEIKKICKYNMHIPVNDMQITEDLHMVLGHCMMKIFCKYE